MTTTPGKRTPKRRWTGMPPTPERLNRLTTTETRVYAYIAWAAGARRRVTRAQLGLIHGDNGAPIGPRAVRQICHDLHDAHLILLPGWGDATDTTPLPAIINGSGNNRGTGKRPTTDDGIKVGTGFIAPRTLPDDLLADLEKARDENQHLNATPTADRDIDWLTRLTDLTERRASLFHRWAAQDSRPAIEREAERLTNATADLHRQLEDKRSKQQGWQSPGEA
ncbi:hypothetical protein [Streptomyces sp. TR02-1]|uniref:hypothetical protein n=1 Tax=Streptomyces sp. TR02-1 TaxID=3385977 RepID=UPI0039A01EE6